MILLVCGPPGAGKTTVTTLLQKRFRERGVSAGLLDSDAFSRNPYDRMFDRVADSDRDWIVAGTFYKRQWQEQFRRLDDVLTVYLAAELDTCLERNRQREHPIDEAAVHIVYREFEPPDADVTVDVDDLSPAAVVDQVVAAFADLPDDRRPSALDALDTTG
ncbi:MULTISPECIES: hypothetical protein [Salinibaculum]|uniref:hypothetical protein n=1 Tax=Salinibaculum TaxID=2732368 RepID=UPI0030D14B5C